MFEFYKRHLPNLLPKFRLFYSEIVFRTLCETDLETTLVLLHSFLLIFLTIVFNFIIILTLLLRFSVIFFLLKNAI